MYRWQFKVKLDDSWEFVLREDMSETQRTKKLRHLEVDYFFRKVYKKQEEVGNKTLEMELVPE